MKKECLVAPKYKRIAAWMVDTMIIMLLWCLLTSSDLKQVSDLVAVLDPQMEGALDSFVEALFKMITSFCLKWLFCQTLYFCLVPAIVGAGKTLGKLLLRLSLVDLNSLEEMSPSRLVLREFVGRTLMETMLVIPGIISIGMVFISKNGLSLRDRVAKTIVIQDTSYLI